MLPKLTLHPPPKSLYTNTHAHTPFFNKDSISAVIKKAHTQNANGESRTTKCWFTLKALGFCAPYGY